MIVDIETIKSVSRILNHKFTGYEQDWFVEFADSNRLSEFITILNNKDLSFSEKYAILSITISSYDEFLFERKDDGQRIWKEIVKILDTDKAGYQDILNYWALWKERNREDLFNITPLIRAYLQTNGIPDKSQGFEF